MEGFLIAAVPLLFLICLMVWAEKSGQPYRCRICGGITEEQRKDRCRGACNDR